MAAPDPSSLAIAAVAFVILLRISVIELLSLGGWINYLKLFISLSHTSVHADICFITANGHDFTLVRVGLISCV